MDDVEKFKWLVSRMDMFHDVFGEQISDMDKRIEKYSEIASSKLKETRNYVLSAIGIFLTILFGYVTSFPLEQWIFYLILGILSATGFTIFIIINWLTKNIENVYADLSLITRTQHATLLTSKGHLTLSVAKLEVIEYKYVENYLIFVLLLTASIMLQFSKDYHKISKKYPYLRDMKQSLEIESKKYRAGINERHIILGLEKLDRSQNLPVDVLKFIEKTLEKYKEKETTG